MGLGKVFFLGGTVSICTLDFHTSSSTFKIVQL